MVYIHAIMYFGVAFVIKESVDKYFLLQFMKLLMKELQFAQIFPL